MTASIALQALHHRHAWDGFLRLERLARLVGPDPEWSLEPDGLLTLAGHRFPGTQILGTRSASSASWRWGDANASAPPALVVGAARGRAALRAASVPEADEPQFWGAHGEVAPRAVPPALRVRLPRRDVCRKIGSVDRAGGRPSARRVYSMQGGGDRDGRA